MKIKQLSIAAILFAMTVPATAAVNVVQGATVTPQGAFGVGGGGWGSGSLAPASTLTDGAFLPEYTQWNVGSVWWGSSTPFSSDNFLVVDLGSVQSFDHLVLQADNNDSYAVEYWNGSNWASAWNASAVSGWGMMTRASALLPVISSQYLRVHATSGDSFYSVSELQALAPVPEPETWALMGFGLLATTVTARRRRKA